MLLLDVKIQQPVVYYQITLFYIQDNRKKIYVHLQFYIIFLCSNKKIYTLKICSIVKEIPYFLVFTRKNFYLISKATYYFKIYQSTCDKGPDDNLKTLPLQLVKKQQIRRYGWLSIFSCVLNKIIFFFKKHVYLKRSKAEYLLTVGHFFCSFNRKKILFSLKWCFINFQIATPQKYHRMHLIYLPALFFIF